MDSWGVLQDCTQARNRRFKSQASCLVDGGALEWRQALAANGPVAGSRFDDVDNV